jgi:hypothetical protein
MSQRVHADTEHRRGENLKRNKTKQNKKQNTKVALLITPFPNLTPSPPVSMVRKGSGAGRDLQL